MRIWLLFIVDSNSAIPSTQRSLKRQRFWGTIRVLIFYRALLEQMLSKNCFFSSNWDKSALNGACGPRLMFFGNGDNPSIVGLVSLLPAGPLPDLERGSLTRAWLHWSPFTRGCEVEPPLSDRPSTSGTIDCRLPPHCFFECLSRASLWIMLLVKVKKL